MAEKELVGKVTHFFDKIGVAVIELEKHVKDGEEISIEGATTHFTQPITSMQINHKEIKEAKPGDSIGMKMSEKVRPGDHVFRLMG